MTLTDQLKHICQVEKEISDRQEYLTQQKTYFLHELLASDSIEDFKGLVTVSRRVNPEQSEDLKDLYQKLKQLKTVLMNENAQEIYQLQQLIQESQEKIDQLLTSPEVEQLLDTIKEQEEIEKKPVLAIRKAARENS